MLARLLNEKEKEWEGLEVIRTPIDKHSLRSPGGQSFHTVRAFIM